MFRIFSVIIGYFLGCIQSAYIIGKLTRNVDIRELGSGNSGTTNAFRTMGTKAGIIVFIIDVLKAVVAFVICMLLFSGGGTHGILPGLYGGLGVILGHDFPFFMGFKGGKGIAASIGLIICLDVRIALIVFIISAIGILITKWMSFGSIIMMISFPIALILFGYSVEVCVISIFIAALSIYKHRGNILRMIHGEERKFNFGLKEKKA